MEKCDIFNIHRKIKKINGINKRMLPIPLANKQQEIILNNEELKDN